MSKAKIDFQKESNENIPNIPELAKKKENNHQKKMKIQHFIYQ